MKKVSSYERAQLVVGILGLSTVLACGAAGEDAEYDGDAEGEPPATSVEAVPSTEAQVEESGRLVFEHAYSDTGRFTIHEHRDGILQAAVTGSSEDTPDFGADAIWQETFTGIFQSLSPDLEIPEELAALDARLAAHRQSVTAAVHERAPAAEPSMVVEKSYAWFLNNVCKTHNTGSGWRFKPWGCWYSGPVQRVETSVGYNNHTFSNRVNDRVYALNDSTDTTNLWICKKGRTWCSSSVQIPPNGGWSWTQASVTPFTNDYFAAMNTQLGFLGALGITIHYGEPVIH